LGGRTPGMIFSVATAILSTLLYLFLSALHSMYLSDSAVTIMHFILSVIARKEAIGSCSRMPPAQMPGAKTVWYTTKIY
jgi:hypothetical protein